MQEVLSEQKFTSFSPEAWAYRNMNRHRVDKLFKAKLKNKGKLRKKLDFKARQLWRRIIVESNKL